MEGCGLLLQASPFGWGQGELVGVQKQAEFGVLQLQGCPEGGSETPDPVGLVWGHQAGTPRPCHVQAGGELLGPWVEAEGCSGPPHGLSLTNLPRET